jgi:hypothetical protein
VSPRSRGAATPIGARQRPPPVKLYQKFPADDVAAISPEGGKSLLQLLDVRVEVLGYGPLRLRISGSVSDSHRAKSGVGRVKFRLMHDSQEWAARDSNPARRIKSPELYQMS